jgi:hypothetical protein
VKTAVVMVRRDVDRPEADRLLADAHGRLSGVVGAPD